MREVKQFSLEHEELEEQRAAGRYNPALVLRYRDKSGEHRVTINAGFSDDVSLYRERHTTFVLSRNDRLGYVALEAFVDGEPSGDIFLQTDHEIESVLGKRGLDYADRTIVQKLAEYL